MAASPPPSASRIALSSTDERFVLETPRRGLHAAGIGQLVGAFLVLVICAQWTGRTWADKGSCAASASLPFWLCGLAILVSATHAMLRHHRLELRSETAWIRAYPIGRKKPVRAGTLVARLDHVTRGEADGRGGSEVPVLVLDDGHHLFRLLEGFPETEQRWVERELNAWLARRHGRQR